jgi:hypothetical protein
MGRERRAPRCFVLRLVLSLTALLLTALFGRPRKR